MTREEASPLLQYVFLDVVRFTQGRTIEAQVDIVSSPKLIACVALMITSCLLAWPRSGANSSGSCGSAYSMRTSPRSEKSHEE